MPYNSLSNFEILNGTCDLISTCSGSYKVSFIKMGRFLKDKRGIYCRNAKQHGCKTKSGCELLEIQHRYHIFKDVTKAVDLCAAPGHWTRVLSEQLCFEEAVADQVAQMQITETSGESSKEEHAEQDGRANVPNGAERTPAVGIESTEESQCAEKASKVEDVKIVAVDLQPMVPIPGVIHIQNDITKPSTASEVLAHFDGTKVDLVVCNRTMNDTGFHSIDTYKQEYLLLGALHVTCTVLKHGGNFVAKVFRDKDVLLHDRLTLLFKEVIAVKHSSSDDFLVCLCYCSPNDFDSSQLAAYLDERFRDFSHLLGSNRVIIPFLVCGDVSAYDLETPCPQTTKDNETSKNKGLLETPIRPPYLFLTNEDVAKQEEETQELAATSNANACEKEYESLIRGCLGIDEDSDPDYEAKRSFVFQPQQPNFERLIAEVAEIRAQNDDNVCKKPVRLSDYLVDNARGQKEASAQPCIVGSKLKTHKVFEDRAFFEETASALNQASPGVSPTTAEDLNALIQKMWDI